jgi:hypothetical protein
LLRNKISQCHICGVIFDSERKLRHHVDDNHRVTGDMTVTPREAEVIARDVLSTNFYANKKIFAISIIKQNEGRTLAAKSTEYFKKAFGDVIAEGNGYGRTLATAIATMSVVTELGDILGQPRAIITIHKRCKLMLIPMPSYDIVVGLVVDRSSDVNSYDNIANKIQSLVSTTIKPEKKL